MRNFYGFLLFCIIPFSTNAQSSGKLDSLRNLLARLPQEGQSYAEDTARVGVLYNIGEEFFKSKRDTALIIGQAALQLAKSINYKEGELKANILIGKYYYFEFSRVKSSEYFLKALAISEHFKRYDLSLYLTKSLGDNYLLLGENKAAIQYYIKHVVLCKRYGSKEQYLLSYNNLGIAYFQNHNYTKALYYFKLCESESKKINSVKAQNAGLINVAMVQTKLGLYDEALERYNRALKIDDGYNDRIAYISNAKADIFLQKNDLKNALNQGLIALKNIKEAPTRTYGDVSLTLSKVYQRLSQPKEALEFYKKYAEITFKQDSIKNSQLIGFMRVDYINEKQIQEIKNLNNNLERQALQRNISIVITLTFIVILTVIYFFNKSLRNKNIQIEHQKKSIEDLNLTLEKKVVERTYELSEANQELILKNQEIIEALFKGQTIERKRVASELHDNLGGTITAIKWQLAALDDDNLSEKEKQLYDSIMSMIENAYADVRHISHNLLPVEFEERGLKGAIEKLCSDINQNKKLQIHFRYSEEIPNIGNKTALELYSICMESVNNILKHAGANKAEIEFQYNATTLRIEIKDNGKGISEGSKRYGMGFKNLANRIEALGGTLEISSDIYWKTKIIVTLTGA